MPTRVTFGLKDTGGVATATLTESVDVGTGANRALIAWAWNESSSDRSVAAATYDGEAMTLMEESHPEGGTVFCNVIAQKILDPNSGANDLSITLSVSQLNWGIAWVVYEDVEQTVGFSDGTMFAMEGASSVSQNLSSGTSRIGLDFVMRRSTTAGTPSGDATHVELIEEVEISDNAIAIGETDPSYESLDMGWSWSSSADLVHHITDVIPFGVAPSGTPDGGLWVPSVLRARFRSLARE